jgi:ABC-type transporter lipoprotein component MlaA
MLTAEQQQEIRDNIEQAKQDYIFCLNIYKQREIALTKQFNKSQSDLRELQEEKENIECILTWIKKAETFL